MGKASRLKKQRRTIHRQHAVMSEQTVTPQAQEASASADGANPVVALRSILLDRGWVEQPPDGVLSQLWFEFPDTLTDYAPKGASDPDGIHPATVLVCARSSDSDGFLRDFEIHVDLAGRDPGPACPEHAAPPSRTFPLDATGLTDLAGQLDEIEQHVASWPDMIACADGPGACR
ncbi:hypothetical protein [Prauserella flavalba]|uniref:hypothetical protein n=1 Tax=Prauserella flavalba TaxID=1477506 RepID=UPI0036E3D6E3